MKQYFRGYYFKCCGEGSTAAFIPALHVDGEESSASLQVITGDTVFIIPYRDIKFDKHGFGVKIGRNYFSGRGMSLNVNTKGCKIHGKIRFGPLTKLKYNIMGPFQCIPFMQCRHTVISMSHTVKGDIQINDERYSFKNGTGYIEGDCGSSFPSEYIWTQCHCKNGSVMVAVADIPLMGLNFKGIIGIVMIGDKEYRIATYSGARVVSVSGDTVVIRQGKYKLSARLIEPNHQELNAPVNGKMARTIHESVSCRAEYVFSYRGKKMLEFTSDEASFEFEMGEKIKNP